MSEKDIVKETRPRMETVIEDFRRKLGTIRTGRAAVSLLDTVLVDYYGTMTPLNQMASVHAPEPQMLTVQPWDQTQIGTVEKAIRAADRLYRCGSDEFLVLLPETLNDGAQALAKRLMNEIVACAVPHQQHPMKVLTVSAGVSSRDQWMTDVSWQDIVERATDALQQARKLGPNRVVSAQRDESFASDTVFVQGTIPRQ